MNTGQRAGSDHVAHHFHRVMLDDADIADLVVINALEQGTDTGIKDFHAQEIVVGTSLGNFLGGFTHAKPDFQNQGIVIAKHRFRFQDVVAVADRPQGQEARQGLLLAGRNVRAPMNKATDMGLAGIAVRDIGRQQGLFFRCWRSWLWRGHQEWLAYQLKSGKNSIVVSLAAEFMWWHAKKR